MNQLKTGIMLSYLSIFANVIVGIVYTPIMLRFLGQSEYGLYSLCVSMIGYLALFNFGFSSAYVRYYSLFKAKDDELKIKRLNGLFVIVFSIIAILVIISGSIIIFNLQFILGDKFTEQEFMTAKILMCIMIFNLALTMPSSVFSSFITSREKFVFQKGIEVAKKVCNPVLTLPLLFMGYHSIAVVLVASFFTIVSFGLNIWYCRYILKIQFEFNNFDILLLKDVFIFSFFIFLQILMDKMNWEINKFIVGRYCGSIAIAIYAVGANLNMFFIEFSTAISNVFVPRINKLIAEKQGNEHISILFSKVARIQFIVVFYIFTSFVFFGQKFIFFWAGEGYANSYIIALLLMTPIVLPLTETLGIEILRAKNLHKFINSVYIGICIVSVAITIPLCQRYGEIGGAMGTFITMLFAHVIVTNIYYHFKAKIDIKLYFREIFKFIPASILPCLLGLFVLMEIQIKTVYEFIFWVGMYTLIYMFSYWKIGVNKYEKDMFYSILRKVWK